MTSGFPHKRPVMQKRPTYHNVMYLHSEVSYQKDNIFLHCFTLACQVWKSLWSNMDLTLAFPSQKEHWWRHGIIRKYSSSGGVRRETTCWHQAEGSNGNSRGPWRLVTASDLATRTTWHVVFSVYPVPLCAKTTQLPPKKIYFQFYIAWQINQSGVKIWCLCAKKCTLWVFLSVPCSLCG